MLVSLKPLHHPFPALQRCRKPRHFRGNVAAAAVCPAAPLDLIAFTFIIDDLVYPDGTTLMAQPGGGGPQTLFGYQLFSAQRAAVGLAAEVGPDLPPACAEWLARGGVQLEGLLEDAGAATPRAWQVLEADGRRAEIWRTLPTERLAAMLRPPLAALPPAFQAAKSYHVAVNPVEPGLEHLRQLRQAAGTGILSVETFTTAARPLEPPELHSLLSLCDIFSPNEAEALTILGLPQSQVAGPQGAPQPSLQLHSAGPAVQVGSAGDLLSIADSSEEEPEALLRLTLPFLNAGARVVAVRRGSAGALVHSKQEGAWQVPSAAGTRVVDTTGCGNAFCGALLAALAAGERLEVAGAWGCVAGSLMAEHLGVPAPSPAELHGEALRRLEELLPRVRRLG